MPKVSVCVPAYGNAAGIARLLASIKEQTFTDYEVVLTDDSADDSVKKAAEESGVNNLHYYRNKARLGAAGNWNEAVEKSAGAFIKMMHHDDWFSSPDSLRKFVRLLEEEPDALLAFSGTWQVTLPSMAGETQRGMDCGAERFARAVSEEQERLICRDWRNLFLGNYIGAPSATIYRRNGQKFETGLTWVMDTEYYMRLLRDKPRFSCTKEPLVCIGVSASQLTEQCRADGALNLLEYGFLFTEFGLETERRYREKLIEVALKYHIPYARVEKYKIPRKEFQDALRKKRMADFLFLLGVAKRKLLRCLPGRT